MDDIQRDVFLTLQIENCKQQIKILNNYKNSITLGALIGCMVCKDLFANCAYPKLTMVGISAGTAGFLNLLFHRFFVYSKEKQLKKLQEARINSCV